MKISTFKAKLLEIICPPIITLYEQRLVPKLKEISKPALHSIFIEDKSNPMQNYDWAFLYLDEKKLYTQSKLEFTEKFFLQGHEDRLSKDINDRYAKIGLYVAKRIMRNFSFEEENEFETIFNNIGLDKDFFIKTSIAQFYNSLSVIQSGHRINDLLYQFIHKGQMLSLVKAVKVDPSVLELEVIKNVLNQLDPIPKNKLEGKLHDAKSTPHLSPDKRKQYLLLAVFLNFASAIGYLSAPKPIPNKLLQDLATGLNIIPVDYDEDEFRKTARYYRNR